MNEKAVLIRLVNTLEQELTDTLVGVYLHGAKAMGYFHPKQRYRHPGGMRKGEINDERVKANEMGETA
ncbi:hypothetical protein HNR77_002273 [Paenibacillus sp. JGP012]|uniref:hypothetical protein n=1 Tax=Paenibacillus sp. JGP012 TaxID=2735914 RepID=UPI00161A9E20|nr:hypothetical protein [Paenibacillus sp. JGP012]MBB6021180.1 hypothetical protein [Paenibacillus sp. JGP012]